MNILWKTLGGLVTLFAVILIVFSYKDVIPFFTGNPAERLESLWERDFITLVGSKSLPEGFFQVQAIEYTPVSAQAQEWLKSIKSPLSVKKAGDFKLVVMIDDWKDGEEFGAVIQYQLIDLKTGDTVWELGRTLNLSENPTKTPPVRTTTTSTTVQ